MAATPARIHQLFWFCLSGACVAFGLLVAAYFGLVRGHGFGEVQPLLQGAFVLACIFWMIGMVIARRHRRMMLAIAAHPKLDDDLAKSVTHG